MFTYSRAIFDSAITDYTTTVQLDPDDAETYASRGAAYGIIGKGDKAISDCTKAIELGLNHADIYFNRAIAYNSIREFELAISDYTKTIELNPKHVKSLCQSRCCL